MNRQIRPVRLFIFTEICNQGPRVQRAASIPNRLPQRQPPMAIFAPRSHFTDPLHKRTVTTRVFEELCAPAARKEVSVWALLALAVGLAFPLLDLFGFEAGAGPAQDPGALTALAVTYALVPVALKSGAIALMWNFPLDETRQSKLRASIERD